MLKELDIFGFKSIPELRLELKPINVLIGANGAGKSNFIDIFRLLASLKNNSLQFYVGKSGGANSLLHYGTEVTPQMAARFCLDIDLVLCSYGLKLVEAPIDTLIFLEESFESLEKNENLGTGHKESLFFNAQPLGTHLKQKVQDEIKQYHVFQFHNTSETAKMRGNCELHNNRSLLNDGGNLAAVLYKLQQTQFPYYERIVDVIRQIAPFFSHFILEPLALNPNYIQLHWRSCYSKYDFGPHQLSDGTLRTMALITTLLQPESDLPSLIVLDEPELGLHPYAITVLASLIRSASVHTQIILATQSSTFIDHFNTDEVIVVEQKQGVSSFNRLVPEELTEWLEEYTLSELWEKNVIGGRPGR
jgi:predicted ATPase